MATTALRTVFRVIGSLLGDVRECPARSPRDYYGSLHLSFRDRGTVSIISNLPPREVEDPFFAAGNCKHISASISLAYHDGIVYNVIQSNQEVSP